MTPSDLALLTLIDAVIEKWDAENPATKWPASDAAKRRERLLEAKRLIPGDTL